MMTDLTTITLLFIYLWRQSQSQKRKVKNSEIYAYHICIMNIAEGKTMIREDHSSH